MAGGFEGLPIQNDGECRLCKNEIYKLHSRYAGRCEYTQVKQAISPGAELQALLTYSWTFRSICRSSSRVKKWHDKNKQKKKQYSSLTFRPEVRLR